MTIENSPVVLVDIIHDNDATVLISPELEDDFFGQVLSKLNPSDKVCVEGINIPTGLRSNNEQYEMVVSRLWPQYAAFSRPTLYGADPRPRSDFEQNVKIMLEVDQMLNILDNRVVINEAPQTIEESIQWIKNGYGQIQIIGEIGQKEKELADKIFRLEKIWVKNYGDLVKSCLRTHGRVYVIAGLTHIIDLHVKYGWPILWLSKDMPWVTPTNVYRSGMNFTHFVDKIRRMRD